MTVIQAWNFKPEFFNCSSSVHDWEVNKILKNNISNYSLSTKLRNCKDTQYKMTAWNAKSLTGQDIKAWATETFCNMHLSNCHSKKMLWHKLRFNTKVGRRLQLSLSLSMEPLYKMDSILNWMPRDDPRLLINKTWSCLVYAISRQGNWTATCRNCFGSNFRNCFL